MAAYFEAFELPESFLEPEAAAAVAFCDVDSLIWDMDLPCLMGTELPGGHFIH